jgi:hypothetical protein
MFRAMLGNVKLEHTHSQEKLNNSGRLVDVSQVLPLTGNYSNDDHKGTPSRSGDWLGDLLSA